MVMYTYTKFKSVWRTSDFKTKFGPENMADKYFERINIKIEIRI